MTRSTTITLLLFLAIHCPAQILRIPHTSNSEKPIKLDNVNIVIDVIGNHIYTETTFTFYNPNDRILEGELNFPLNDNQLVDRFAMDLNGKMRESVFIEKSKGTHAFENVIRQEIDPALLEQKNGNNYQARVYPIPPKGTKKILLGTYEALQSADQIYSLFADYGSINNVQVHIKLHEQSEPPIILNNQLGVFNWSTNASFYSGTFTKHKIQKPIAFKIKLSESNHAKTLREVQDGFDYFITTVRPPDLKVKRRTPKYVTLIWDSSHSTEKRNIKKELEFLETYVSKIKKIKLQIIVFSNEVHYNQKHTIRNGNIEDVIHIVKTQPLDGGTDYSCLSEIDIKSKEAIMFSDGLNNLSKLKEINSTTPIHFISSATTKNIQLINSITKATGGVYVDLNETSIDDAVESLYNSANSLLSISFDDRLIHDVFPKSISNLDKNRMMTISGKIKSGMTGKLLLSYGTKEKSIKLQTIEIELNEH